MTLVTSLLLLKLVLILGLAIWVAVVTINNITAFRGGVASVGAMMSMRLFDQAPAIDSPLLKRRVASPVWHRLIYGIVLAVEGLVAILLCYAAIGLANAVLGIIDVTDAVRRANLALSAFLTMGFIMLLGGTWFAYYIRQEGMQLTHLLLIVIGIVGALFMNVAV